MNSMRPKPLLALLLALLLAVTACGSDSGEGQAEAGAATVQDVRERDTRENPWHTPT